jgi:copper resistance protein D
LDPVSSLQVGSALLLNLGFAWVVGSWLARRWLRAAACDGEFRDSLRRLDMLAAALAALASAGAVWAATAIMAGVPLGQAGGMLWTMLSATDYGRAGCITVGAMAALAGRRAWRSGESRRDISAMLLIALFGLTRASMGHAGEGGIWTVTLAAEVLHLAAVGVWTGVVIVSGWFILGEARIDGRIGLASRHYLDAMSHAALVAVAVIIGTGLYNAWDRVGAVEHLFDSQYGLTLLAKVVLVGCALTLGGYNKFIGLPAAARSIAGVRTVRRVLKVETVLLVGALTAAALLTTLQPPTAG